VIGGTITTAAASASRPHSRKNPQFALSQPGRKDLLTYRKRTSGVGSQAILMSVGARLVDMTTTSWSTLRRQWPPSSQIDQNRTLARRYREPCFYTANNREGTFDEYPSKPACRPCQFSPSRRRLRRNIQHRQYRSSEVGKRGGQPPSVLLHGNVAGHVWLQIDRHKKANRDAIGARSLFIPARSRISEVSRRR